MKVCKALKRYPPRNAEVLLNELGHYSELLAAKPKCFIKTKTDLLPFDEEKKIPGGWLGISAVTGGGMDAALRSIESMSTLESFKSKDDSQNQSQSQMLLRGEVSP